MVKVEVIAIRQAAAYDLRILAIIATNKVTATAITPDRRIIAVTAENSVILGAADEDVVAVLAIKAIDAGTAKDPVIAVAPKNKIRPCKPDDDVIIRGSIKDLSSLRA